VLSYGDGSCSLWEGAAAALVRVLAAFVFLAHAYGTSFSAGHVPPRQRAAVGVVLEKVGSADERLA
jgi:hypothetical protein